MDRFLGKIEGTMPGPLVICLAAIHGNEQIGIHAFRNVASAIEKHQIKFSGKLVGLLGNAKATASNVRFLDYDLNRCWRQEVLNRVLMGKQPRQAEDEELRQLYEIIERESRGNYTFRVMADLHSTSADKGNFIVISEDEVNHPVIRALKLPTIIGLDKYLEGTLLDYYHRKGFLSFAFEGGMMGTESVYQLHTSGLWEILDKSGCISHHDHDMEDHYADQLAKVSAGLPKKLIVKYRESVKKEDGFRMLPGFHNFQRIKAGQHLAINHRGNILSPMDGLMFMPLYQTEGEDGFFIAEEIN